MFESRYQRRTIFEISASLWWWFGTTARTSRVCRWHWSLLSHTSGVALFALFQSLLISHSGRLVFYIRTEVHGLKNEYNAVHFLLSCNHSKIRITSLNWWLLLSVYISKSIFLIRNYESWQIIISFKSSARNNPEFNVNNARWTPPQRRLWPSI